MCSLDEASRSDPTSRQPVSSSTSSPKFRYRSTEFIIIWVSDKELRSCPTRPAEWKVDPLVSSERSTRATSPQPRRASQYRIEQPPIPPPITTTRALSIMVSPRASSAKLSIPKTDGVASEYRPLLCL